MPFRMPFVDVIEITAVDKARRLPKVTLLGKKDSHSFHQKCIVCFFVVISLCPDKLEVACLPFIPRFPWNSAD